MINYLRLVRIHNLLIIALVQYLMRWSIIYPILRINGFELQISNFYFFLLVLSTIFFAAAGYIINDYFDRKTDTFNHPEKVLIGRKINRRVAMILHMLFNFFAIVLGFFVAYKIGMYKLGFVYLFIPGILWFYSTVFKRQFLIGNFIVAFLVAMIPMLVAFYEIPILNLVYRRTLLQYNANFNNILLWIAGFSFIAFMLTLIFEIIKDMQDFEGDAEYGRNSIPTVLGIINSKIIVTTLSIITCSIVATVMIRHLSDPITIWYYLVFFLLPFIFLIIRIIMSKTQNDYNLSVILIKIIMVSGVFYSIVANYLINPDFFKIFFDKF